MLSAQPSLVFKQTSHLHNQTHTHTPAPTHPSPTYTLTWEHAHINELNATCWLLQTQGFSHTGFCPAPGTTAATTTATATATTTAIATQKKATPEFTTGSHLLVLLLFAKHFARSKHGKNTIHTHIQAYVRGHCPLNKIFTKCSHCTAPSPSPFPHTSPCHSARNKQRRQRQKQDVKPHAKLWVNSTSNHPALSIVLNSVRLR